MNVGIYRQFWTGLLYTSNIDCHCLSPPRFWAHVRGLINVDWLANCLQATPPGKLKDESLHSLCVILSPKPTCLSLYHRGPSLPVGCKPQHLDSSAATLQNEGSAQGNGDHLHYLISLCLCIQDVTGRRLLVEIVHLIKSSG